MRLYALPVIDERYSQSIADQRPIMSFNARLEDYLWQSDVEDDEAVDAATTASVAPPQPARQSADATGPVTAMPPPETASLSSSAVPPKAAMGDLPSNCRVDPSQVRLPSNIHGVVSAARAAEMTRHLRALNRPAIRSPAQVHHATPRLAPPLSAVVRPSGIADPTSPTADRSPAHAATTRHMSGPYPLVRANQHVASAQSTIDPIVDYTEDWRSYRVCLYRDKRWWQWGNGIIDLRPLFPARSSATAGTQLGVGFDACEWVLRRHACEFKVGMARMLGSRWELYRSSPDTWTPSHMFIVMHVRGRDAVGFAEAGLIGMIHACGEYDDGLNVNHRNNDRGGGGPRHECELDDWFWVYLATKSVS